MYVLRENPSIRGSGCPNDRREQCSPRTSPERPPDACTLGGIVESTRRGEPHRVGQTYDASPQHEQQLDKDHEIHEFA